LCAAESCDRTYCGLSAKFHTAQAECGKFTSWLRVKNQLNQAFSGYSDRKDRMQLLTFG
jgi:hypothetical protein